MSAGCGRASIAELASFHYPHIVAKIPQDTGPEGQPPLLGCTNGIPNNLNGNSRTTNDEFIQNQPFEKSCSPTSPFPGTLKFIFLTLEVTITLAHNTLHEHFTFTRFPCVPAQFQEEFLGNFHKGILPPLIVG